MAQLRRRVGSTSTIIIALRNAISKDATIRAAAVGATDAIAAENISIISIDDPILIIIRTNVTTTEEAAGEMTRIGVGARR
jgi:hypothetical protein